MNENWNDVAAGGHVNEENYLAVTVVDDDDDCVDDVDDYWS